VSTGTPTSETIPQAATSLLEVSLEAILQADVEKPIDDWLKAQNDLGKEQQRHVVQILRFLHWLDDSRRLIPETRQWRSDHARLFEALVLRVRRGYASAGCDSRQAELIGQPLLSKEALGRVLEAEPPFQRLKDSGTRGNAVRFVRHVHEAIVEKTLIPQHDTQEDAPPRCQRPPEGGQGGFASSARQPPPHFIDRGTIAGAEQYRIERLQGDVWVYATVQFEIPQGFAGLGEPDADKQAQWKERLAAALLQDADSHQRSRTCGFKTGGP
jgi:hypothetical protein